MRNASFQLHLRASRTFLVILIAAHVVAAFAVLGAILVPVVKVLILLCLGASLAMQRHSSRLVLMEFRPDGTVQVLTDETNSPVGAGDTPMQARDIHAPLPTRLDYGAQILGPMLVMLFPRETKLQPFILLRDSFESPEDYRRLRIWLKWTSSRAMHPLEPRSGHGLQDRI